MPSKAALHSWDLSPREAVSLQRRLAGMVRLAPLERERVRLVAGGDVSFSRRAAFLFAGVVVMELPGFRVVEARAEKAPATFPYLPGLLSFREAPALLEVFSRLQMVPDLVLVDGQGIAHPRRLGLASHLGLWLELPTVGVAKSRLCGWHGALGDERGAQTPLRDGEEQIGCVVRTRAGGEPLYVSPGHLCDFDGAVWSVLACAPKMRLCEPVRAAHRLVNEARRADEG